MMKFFSIKYKISIAIALMVVVAVLSLTLGASFVNYSQIQSKNHERLKAAIASYQRELERMILADKKIFKDFSSNFDLVRKYKIMVLLNYSNDDMPARTTNLAIALKAENLAFYYKANDEDDLNLRHYYSQKRNGTTIVFKNFASGNNELKYILYTQDVDGRTAKSEASQPETFPLTFKPFKRPYSLIVRDGTLILQAVLPYIILVSDEFYGLTKGHEIGQFVLEKKLELNLKEMDKDLGVHFNVYDRMGKMGDGHLNMPDLDPKMSKLFTRKVTELSDTNNKKYDSLLVPLKHDNKIIGYLSANIAQDSTVQKIFETIRLLLIIAIGIIVSFFFLSLLLANRLTRPILKLTHVSEVIAAGKLEETIDINGNDELGILSRSISNMRDSILLKIDALNREIENRKQTQMALLESETKYRLLVENANVGIFVLQDDVMKFPNPKAESLFAYSAEKLAEITISDHIHPEDRYMVLSNHKRRLQGEELTTSYPFRIINGENQEIWIEMSSVLVSWEERPATLNFIKDITQEKKLEVQLQQAHKLEAIGTLAGGIAHDFNNILAAMIGYAELAQLDVPEGSLAAANLAEVTDAGKRAKELVKQILTFSRQGDPEQQPLDIKHIVKETLRLIRASIPTTIKINTDITEESSTVMADPTQIHQILMNLCTNAAHAMQKCDNGGILSVSIDNINIKPGSVAQFHDLKSGRYIRLKVNDTGCGIDKSVQQRIFDPFFTTKGPGEGTGMGLSVVHGIVKSHRGLINVYSELGKGTTFEILIPRIHTLITPETKKIEPLPSGTERILFVDDEELLVNMGDQMLSRLGYKVVARTNSVEALTDFKAQSDKFDLIITDLTMPNMTGEQLAKKINEIRKDIPIILCTGYSQIVSEGLMKRTGIAGFVMKPLIMKDLAKTIRNVLDNRKDA